MNPSLTLNLQADAPTTETVAGWQVERYALSGTARGPGQAPQKVALAPDDVLQIELENGTQLLVAAEDAERYLGKAPARDVGGAAGTPGAIEVGLTLRLSGAHLPPSISRDGVGAWVLKALHVFKRGPASMTALAAAGAFQDSQLEQGPGLFALQTDQWKLSPLAQMPHSTEPALLFLHGTASSTSGSFRALWGGDSEVDARAQIAQAYGNRVYGFEHRSLTDSPIANLLALVGLLPKGARLHLVSHSRGGMLGELLARANRFDSDPFTGADIARFTEHARRTGRQGFEQDAKDLRALNRLMKERAICVERFVRVAATARGTTLASGRLDRWATVMLNLLGKGLAAVPLLQPIAGGYALLQNFVLAVVQARTDARVLPGLEAMMPDSPLVALLNAPDVSVDFPLHVIAGDFDGDSLLSWLGDCLSEAFYGGQTDLVVNTPSMSGGAQRKRGIWLKSVAGPAVHHLSYFKRTESADALLSALGGSNLGYIELAGPSTVVIARGGVHVKPLPEGPIALMLPGIMGSHLAVGRRIWMNPFEMIAGGMFELRVDATGVTPDGWFDTCYERFAQHLAQSHEVRPFAYDWRLSIADAAKKFGVLLDEAMRDAEDRKKPLRIVAHSLGGLVARLALKSRWPRFKAIQGSRLVQFGTPNAGSHSIAAVLTGRDGFVQMIERWLDWKHDMREFLDIVRNFPGVLQLLPWPGDDGKASDGLDYFDPALWQQWRDDDAENQHRPAREAAAAWEGAEGAGDGWEAPLAALLASAKQAVQQIIAAALEPDHTLYVAGSARTPVAIRVVNGQMEIGWTERGDGRVPWATGIPQGVKAWYVDAAHGDLLKYEAAFDDYVKLLETGDCALATRCGARDGADVVFTAAPLAPYTLYPSEEEVVAAAVGGRAPNAARQRGEATISVASIQIFHASLACATTPVLMGAYANDSLRGSALFLDKHLGGSLAQAQAIARYPAQPGQAMVFQSCAAARSGGAIVVGLGAVGALQPGELTRSLAQGLLEFARVRVQSQPSDTKAMQALEVSAVLVGTGYAGFSIAVGMRCLFEAILRSNRLCAQVGMRVRIGMVCLYEEEESRVIAAASAARDLVRDPKFTAALSFDGRIRTGQGGYSARHADAAGADGWCRVHVTGLPDQGLRFTLVTDRARNEVNDAPNQRQAVDGLIRSATHSTADQPGLSRALFELLLPNGLKEVLPDNSGLLLAVDAQAAVYPWELMRDAPAGLMAPLATRIGMVRQLASAHGRDRVATVKGTRALVVGDTQSGLAELTGAQREAAAVAQLLRGQAFDVTLLERPEGQKVWVSLFDEHYRIIHLAAHGTVSLDGKGYTGLVLGPDTYLTTAQISQLRHVPELVFINCCHLGSMAADAQPRWGELAANLATQFIEMGCKAVLAAGWAVDDGAAEIFAATFYRAMLGGAKFGNAVCAARSEAWQRYPASNTWGAYQAYGDELYRLHVHAADDWRAPDYLHAGQIVGDLDRIWARIGPATPGEKTLYSGRLEKIEAAIRARFYQVAQIRTGLARAWADLDQPARAIEHYRAALQADGSMGLPDVEQLANLELCLGEKQAQQQATALTGRELMNTGLQRLQALLAMGKTVQRLSLLGSHWKRCTLLTGKDIGADHINDALRQMTAAYVEASELSLRRDGERDSYPTLDALDGAIVLAARGDVAAYQTLKKDHLSWLEQARHNGQGRDTQDRAFSHAYCGVAALRVDALWAMLSRRASGRLDDAKVRTAIVSAHRELLARLGNADDHDSVMRQLQWLIALLPSSGNHKVLRAAVQKLKTEIESAEAAAHLTPQTASAPKMPPPCPS